MISIQQMTYIMALSEEGQFSRASERCFVTQPTLSMQLKKAEETLGFTIFDRSTNPLEATDFGRQLIEIIRDVLSENERIEGLVNRLKNGVKEHMRIGIIPTVSTYLIPDLFSSWQDKLHDIRITIEELKTEDALLALENKKIDMAILAGPVVNPKLRVTKLYQEEIKAYLPEIQDEVVSTETLVDFHPWLLTKGNCLRTQMIHFCDLQQTDTDAWNYQGGSVELLQRMVDMNGGYTLVPINYSGTESAGYKTIRSESGEKPAREIIALTPNRSSKWKYAEQIIRSIQLKYVSENDREDFKVLSWQ